MATRELLGYHINMENRQLKIVLEGPDCSGKSTIHKKLKKAYPNIDIVDRSFISDIVYAKKFSRDTYMGVPTYIYISYWTHWHANNLNTKIVLFTAKPETLAMRAFNKDEDFTRNRTFEATVAHLAKDDLAFKHYTKAMSTEFGFEYITVDTDLEQKVTMKTITNFIENCMKAYE